MSQPPPIPPGRRCACGAHPCRPYHDKLLGQQIEQLVSLMGPDVIVHAAGRKWRVPRHYIALHGLKAAELPTLGFPEVQT